MIRLLLIGVYLLSVPPQIAWSAAAEQFHPEGAEAGAPLRVPDLAAGAEIENVADGFPADAAEIDSLKEIPDSELPGPETHNLSIASDKNPAGASIDGEQPASATPKEAATQSRRQASAERLRQIGKTAAAILSASGSAASDKRRSDFASGLPRPQARLDDTGGEPSPLYKEGRQDALKLVSNQNVVSLAKTLPPAPTAADASSSSSKWFQRAFLAGVFAAQVANNALTVSMPFVLFHLGLSMAAVSFITALTTALDMSGTLVSTWPMRRFSADSVIRASIAARAAALFGLAALLTAGSVNAPAAIILYSVDALTRGTADTARNAIPMILAGKDDATFKSLYSKFRMAFNSGAVVGPLLVGLLSLKSFSNKSNWLVAVIFGVAALAHNLAPRAPPAPDAATTAEQTPAGQGGGSIKKRIFSDRWMRLALLTSVFLALSPALRALIPPAFAQSILHRPADSAWLVALFGLGGTVGSTAYNRVNQKLSSAAWLKWGAAGAVVLSVGLIPGTFLSLAAGIFVFAALNEMASLSLTSKIKERAPKGTDGEVASLLRFTANGTSAVSRGFLGLAFTIAGASLHAFWIIAAAVAFLAAAQLCVSGRLRAVAAAGVLAANAAPQANLSAVHGLPGRLIAVEGLDGSGKSTQMQLLKERLESQGLKVVTTSWNSSDLVSEAIKKAKKSQSLTPETFALLNATDFTERLQKIILPALQEGAVVLADRYFFTSLARDSVRGNDPLWLRNLYASTLRPDLVFYFKLPVETAIGRVLARSGGRLELSEDYGDDEEASGARADTKGVKYYEGGLDLKLSQDPLENFRLFQTKVTASYDAQAPEFGFKLVDAVQPRTVQHESIWNQVRAILGPLSSYARLAKTEHGPNLFDKDPSQDSENIRRNYQHEKRGVHFYFRNMLLPMQERFARLMDHATIPRAFLHGNPHIDNYAKTAQGAAMVDFDRSRVGPYAWDLVRFMVSLSLRQKKDHGFLDREVARQLYRGYLRGFRHPDKPFSEMRKLKDAEPGKGETSTNAYLKADMKWAGEMRANPLPKNDPDVRTLLEGYMKDREEPNLLKEYVVEEAGLGQGSMGFRKLFLVVLAPRNPRSRKDRIFLNIKEVRSDPDTRWYKNSLLTDGERMRHAAQIYAPGWELRPGLTSLKGKQFYVMQMPPMKAKLKGMLKQEDLQDLAYAAGTQLGRGHRRALADGATAEAVEDHFKARYRDLLKSGEIMRGEITAAHERYLKNLAKLGEIQIHEQQSQPDWDQVP